MNKLRAVPGDELMIDGLLVIESEGCDEVVALVSYGKDAEFIVKACNAHDQLVEENNNLKSMQIELVETLKKITLIDESNFRDEDEARSISGYMLSHGGFL